jgi:hypothetical protein
MLLELCQQKRSFRISKQMLLREFVQPAVPVEDRWRPPDFEPLAPLLFRVLQRQYPGRTRIRRNYDGTFRKGISNRFRQR